MTTHTSLTVRHIPDSDPPHFAVLRSDGHMSGPVEVPSAEKALVEGRPLDTLTTQLRWYLEEFLGYPFPPETEHAERVQAALRKWGETAFNALFNSFEAGQLFAQAVALGDRYLRLQIASNDPTVLAWPWEALYRPTSGPIAQHCQVERRVDVRAVLPPLGTLPQDRVNVLLVIARPYPDDVSYRAVSRRLVELADALPVSIHVLRPPTFDGLRKHLEKHRNHYHILHFDGHGAYRRDPAQSLGRNTLMGAKEGRLVFETVDGEPDLVEADRLSDLLREFALPAVVLNACQSASIDAEGTGPYASVAAALMKAGMRNVVAMAYSLYVSGAQQFLPEFYRRLFKTGRVSEAVRAGRQQMRAERERVCARGTYPLDDWIVPVLYQQEPFDFTFAEAVASKPTGEIRLPEEAKDDRNPYGFVGRDGPVLELERAMHRPPAGILITGLSGVGKTTLARGFLKWLKQTNGLGVGAIWFDFRDIRSAEFVLNRLGEAITREPSFATLGVKEKLDLVERAKDTPLRIVWDNFESARGILGTSRAGNLVDADTCLLRELLTRLRGDRMKVFITSRSSEDWLGLPNLGKPVALPGLDGEERWEFANTVVRDLALKLDRRDAAISELMKLLKGHPLTMRVVLSKLAILKADQITAAIKKNFSELVPSVKEDSEAELFATLQFATDSLPPAWQPLLVPLEMHEGYIEADSLEEMAKQVDSNLTRAMIDGFLGALATAGLVRRLGRGVYELHPLLTSYLRLRLGITAPQVQDAWVRAFAEVLAILAHALTDMPPHEQRVPFFVHEANFYNALATAERLCLNVHYCALLQSLALRAFYTHNLSQSATLYDRLQAHFISTGELERRVTPLHQLGVIAAARRDFGTAEKYYLEAIERSNDEEGTAQTYHQLGIVAAERRDFDTAETWYLKAAEVNERLMNEGELASAYHQLGILGQERREFDVAESWYRKSLSIREGREGVDPDGLAMAYHQLGSLAAQRREIDVAESWYRKSLSIAERVQNSSLIASTCHDLGNCAYRQRKYDDAQTWYLKSVAIKEGLNDEYGAALTYHQLGMIAHRRGDATGAIAWYHKTLEIAERRNDEHGAAKTYHQLGVIMGELRDFDKAEVWLRQCLEINERLKDEHGIAQVYHGLGIVAAERADLAAAERLFQQSLEIKSRIDDDHDTANTIQALGIVATKQREFALAWTRFLKALAVFTRMNDIESSQLALQDLARCYGDAPAHLRAELTALGRESGLTPELLRSIEESATQPPSLTES
jgi:tetratricopeptide (TPR) repeat protein